MENTLIEIRSKQEAHEAWDREAVIIRQEDDYVYVYPLLGKGYTYPNFDLRRECNLMGFSDVDQAVFWSKSKGYLPYVLKAN